MFALLQNLINVPSNLNSDGTVNWNFVDADAYAYTRQLFSSEEEYYAEFDRAADQLDALGVD